MSSQILVVTTSETTREQVEAVLAEMEGDHEAVIVESLAQMRFELASGTAYHVALVDERADTAAGYDAAREIALHFPLVSVLMLVQYTSQEVLASALDVGARSVLELPPSLEQFTQRIGAAVDWSRAARRQAEDVAAPATGSGRIVALVGAKGGVGTSTLSVVLARLAATRVSTCLVDLDVRAGDLAAYAGIAVRRSMVDLIEVADELTGRALSEVTYPAAHDVHLLPAPADGELGEELDEHAARQILSALRFQYDLVLVDCGSRLDEILVQALDLADEVFVVATPDVPAMRAVLRLDETLDRLATGVGVGRRMILNRVDKTREVQPGIAPKLADVPLAATVPNLERELDPIMNSAQLLEVQVSALNHALAPVLPDLRTRAALPGHAQPGGTAAAPTPPEKRRRLRRAQAGQMVAEFPIAIGLIFAAALLALQMILWGATYLFAANAADEAARAYGVGLDHPQVVQRVHDSLPSGWVDGAHVSRTAGDVVTVSLSTPSIVSLPAVQATSTVFKER